MMLYIADALPLILERSGRRTEAPISTMLALLFPGRSLWRRRNGYCNRMSFNRNGRNHRVARDVDDRDSARGKIGVAFISHVGSGSVGRNAYRNRSYVNSNGRNEGVSPGVDDRDEFAASIGHVGSRPVGR